MTSRAKFRAGTPASKSGHFVDIALHIDLPNAIMSTYSHSQRCAEAKCAPMPVAKRSWLQLHETIDNEVKTNKEVVPICAALQRSAGCARRGLAPVTGNSCPTIRITSSRRSRRARRSFARGRALFSRPASDGSTRTPCASFRAIIGPFSVLERWRKVREEIRFAPLNTGGVAFPSTSRRICSGSHFPAGAVGVSMGKGVTCLMWRAQGKARSAHPTFPNGESCRGTRG
jgi:hypothetical protein